jgi:uncharacterized protein YegL
MKSLFEGSTVCFPEKGKNCLLSDLAYLRPGNTSDATYSTQPCILIGAPSDCAVAHRQNSLECKLEPGNGRLVVDTAYTKLWLEWKNDGVARYVCNATVWLLGLEYRINRALRDNMTAVDFLAPLRIDQTVEFPPPYIPALDMREEFMDFHFLLDASGSVSNPDFEQAKKFTLEACQLIEKELVPFSANGSRASIIQFASGAQVMCNLTDNFATLTAALKQGRIGGGTSFHAALQAAFAQATRKRPNSKTIIFLQTDGGASDYKEDLEVIRREGYLLFAVGVGSGVATSTMLELVGGVKERFIHANDYSSLSSILRPLLRAVISAVGPSRSK